MSYILGLNRDQMILLPEVLDDYINDDNAARFIDTFVDNLDMSLFKYS